MKKLAFILITIIAILVSIFAYPKKESLPTLNTGMRQELETYIKNNYQKPVDYVVNKFSEHDIVFIGEFHRIKHDVEFIQNLIPYLYENEIYNLGIEFACYEDQDKINQLIMSSHYDENLANELQFNFWPFWGFKEYVDIYKATWSFNNQLPEGSKKFKVVGLGSKSDWRYVKTVEDRSNPEIMKKVFADGNPDLYMASVIINEFIDKDEKALIFSGINHAYTKFKQPIYNKENDTVKFVENRMGNVIYDKIGNRCMTIFLHSPWNSKDLNSNITYPVDGYIDSLMLEINKKYMPVGFDITGTPFANLTGDKSYWQYGYTNFNLATYCDGYIFIKPFSEYEGVTVIPDFINEENKVEAIHQIANPSYKNMNLTVSNLINSVKNDADIKKRFKKLK